MKYFTKLPIAFIMTLTGVSYYLSRWITHNNWMDWSDIYSRYNNCGMAHYQQKGEIALDYVQLSSN